MLEGAALARAFRVEQRQLAAACVRTDEREVVLPVDDVHAEMSRRELDDRVALGHPEGDVIQRVRFHSASLAIRTALRLPRGSDDFFTGDQLFAATARWSCALFMRERPLIPRRFASL